LLEGPRSGKMNLKTLLLAILLTGSVPASMGVSTTSTTTNPFLTPARRSLKRSSASAQRRNNFAQAYTEKVSPNTFTTDFTPDSTSNDFQLACENGDVNENLYGAYADQVDCQCDDSTYMVYCAYLEPVCFGDTADTSFCTAEYFVWAFDTYYGHYIYSSYCSLCESGLCLEDTNIFNGYCAAVAYQALGFPPTCAVGFASDGFAAS